MADKVKSWKERLAQAKIDLPLREHSITGAILDAEDRTIIRSMDPFWAPAVVEAFKLAERYDKVRQYIRAGLTDQLFPTVFSQVPLPSEQLASEERMHVYVDEHIDQLPPVEEYYVARSAK